jgi:hypothetical protein
MKKIAYASKTELNPYPNKREAIVENKQLYLKKRKPAPEWRRSLSGAGFL